MTAIQKFRIVLIAVVTSCVFWISAGHIIEVAQRVGNDRSIALFYPVCIDGVILISAFTLIARNGVSAMTKVYAKLGRWFGFGATIYANVAASEYASTDAMLINLIPAVSLIITIELLIHASQGTTAYRATASKNTMKTNKSATVSKLRSIK